MAKIFLGTLVFSLILPQQLAAATPSGLLVGTVTRIIDKRIIFRTTNAMVYDAEASGAQLIRRNGAPMEFREIAVGDKIHVAGPVWADRSISASVVRNMSLYAHPGSFSGRITAIDHVGSSFTLQGGVFGAQKIMVSPLTRISGKASTVRELEIGMTARVTGTWERSRAEVLAESVAANFRLLNIDITGQVVMKDGSTATVVAGAVIYAVQAGNAKIRNKNNKIIQLHELPLGVQVRVQGKHIAERPTITATQIKELP